MGLFNFLSNKKPKNGHAPKPFYKNESDLERREWFQRTAPWDRVKPEIINALIEIYKNDPMFEVFVITSMRNSLVYEYDEIGKKNVDPRVACSMISGTLFKHGANAASRVIDTVKSGGPIDKQSEKFFEAAMNMLESSTKIDPNQFAAYALLAQLMILFNQNNEALKFAHQGLQIIERLNEDGVPFSKSNIPDIQNFQQLIDRTESDLRALIGKIS